MEQAVEPSLENLPVAKEMAVPLGRSCASGEQALAAAEVVVEAALHYELGPAAVDAAEWAVEEEPFFLVEVVVARRTVWMKCFAEEAVPLPTFY